MTNNFPYKTKQERGKMKTVKLVNKDSIKLVSDMAERKLKVDVIITDIPYGITQAKHDIFPKKEFFNDIWKITNTFITTVDRRALVQVVNAMPKSIKWYDIIWDKDMPSGHLNALKQPLRKHEIILVMYKKQPTYNPQKWDSGKYYNAKRGTFSYGKDEPTNRNYGKMKKNIQTNTTMRHPTSIIKFKKPHPSVALHATEKPVKLYEWLVRTYSNVGDVVFDPFMGSGTTGVASIKWSRRFLGSELEKEFFEIAKGRINETNIYKT